MGKSSDETDSRIAVGDAKTPVSAPLPERPPLLPEEGIPAELREARDSLNKRFDGVRRMIEEYESEKGMLDPGAMKARIDAIQEEYEAIWRETGRFVGGSDRIDDPLQRRLSRQAFDFYVWLYGARSECAERDGSYESAGRWMATANRFDMAIRRLDRAQGETEPEQARREEANWDREAALLRKGGISGWGLLAYRIVEREADSIRDGSAAARKK